jgi:hypothetical protein
MLIPEKIVLPALLCAMLAAGTTAASAQTSQTPPGSGAATTGSSGSSDSAGATGAGTTGSSTAQSRAAQPASVPLIVLMPAAASADPTLYNGCWARLMDNVETPTQKDQLIIVGKMLMPSMQTASGVNWAGKADGLVTGPNARVTVYPAEKYAGPGITLKPGQVVQDIRKQYGFVSAIESMIVECAA